MSEWITEKMGNVANFLNGRAYKATEFKEFGTPIIRIQNLTGVGNYVYSDLELEENKYIDKNDLIYAWSATFGPYIWKGPKSIYHYHIWKILCDKEKLNKKYFYYHLLNVSDELRDQGNGTLFIHITKELMENFNMKLPPLPEQRNIAEALSCLDDKIDLLHLNNKTLEELAETLFKKWFLLELKDDCKKSSLGELIKVIDNRGKTPAFSEIKTDYPVIEVNALNGSNRYIDYSVIKKYVDENTYNNWFRAGHPKLNDILFSTVGSIGEISMMLNEAGCIAQNIVALRAEKISPYYLYQYLMSIQDEIKEFDIGSVQPSIKVTHLTKIEIPMPDSNKVYLFDNQAKDICNKISINYNQIQQLETLRDTLLPKLMSGVVRVEN